MKEIDPLVPDSLKCWHFRKLTLPMNHSCSSALMYWLFVFVFCSCKPKQTFDRTPAHTWKQQKVKSTWTRPEQECAYTQDLQRESGCSFSHHSIGLPVSDRWNWFDGCTLSQQITAQQLHSWTHMTFGARKKMLICICDVQHLCAILNWCCTEDLKKRYDIYIITAGACTGDQKQHYTDTVSLTVM